MLAKLHVPPSNPVCRFQRAYAHPLVPRVLGRRAAAAAHPLLRGVQELLQQAQPAVGMGWEGEGGDRGRAYCVAHIRAPALLLLSQDRPRVLNPHLYGTAIGGCPHPLL